jgi:hypothetical protein
MVYLHDYVSFTKAGRTYYDFNQQIDTSHILQMNTTYIFNGLHYLPLKLLFSVRKFRKCVFMVLALKQDPVLKWACYAHVCI